MTVRRFIGISALVLSVLVLPQFAFARTNDYNSHNEDQAARLNVYVRTISSYGPAIDPWRFQVQVQGADARPYQFEGSANGTTVVLDANTEFEVGVSERYGYHASLSGMCEGEIRRYETANCYITLTQGYRDGYPYPPTYPQYPAPQPYYPAQYPQPVSLITNYIPSQMPNTGFDPSQGPAMIAFALVLLAGAGIAVYPYVRKVTAALR